MRRWGRAAAGFLGVGKSVAKLNLHNFESPTAACKWLSASGILRVCRNRNGNDVFDFDYANLSVATMLLIGARRR